MARFPLRPIGELTVNLDRRRVPVKASERRPGPFPYYGASGVVDHVDGFLFEGLHLLVAEDGENLRSRKSPVAFLADGRFWVNNHAHVLRGNSDNDTRFLAYAMEATDISGYITGSAQPKLSQAALRSIHVVAPCLRQQRAIAATLGALDDKIESNRRKARLLLGIAQSTFDLVEQRAEERVPLASGYTVGLSGVWGGDRETSRETVATNCFRGRDLEEFVAQALPNPPTRWISPGQLASRRFSEGEIWTAGSGTLGPSLLITRTLQSGWRQPITYSNFVKRLVPNGRLSPALAWLAVDGSRRRGEFENFRTGTAMPNLDPQAMLRGVTVPVADRFVEERLRGLVEGALDPQPLRENARLMELRDALLPELLSGRVRVPETART